MEGKRVQVFLFGDYELQATLYGLSGSSGLHPCLHCIISRHNMQLPGATAEHRSLEMLLSDHRAFTADGARLANAKKFNNCIRPPILPIQVEDAIIPVLHLDLGIYPWIFDALTKECQRLDIALAASGSVTDADSTKYADAVAKHRQLNTKQAELAHEETTAQHLEQQLAWVAIHSTDFAQELVEGAAQAIQRQCQTQVQKVSKLQAEIKSLSDQLQVIGNLHGPCEASLEPVLQKHICRQRYHGGAFIGNHVHKALNAVVIAELTSAPSAVVTSEDRVAPQSVVADAAVIAQRYSTLLTQFANCHRRYSSCKAMSADDVQCLENDITKFIESARQEIVNRHLGNITSKLHLLEKHLADAMARF